MASVDFTMDHKKLDFGSNIASEILTRAKQLQTSLSFSSLIIALYRRVSVSFFRKTDVEITPSISTNKLSIEVELQFHLEDRTSKMLVDTTPVVDMEMLGTGTSEIVHKTGIPSSLL